MLASLAFLVMTLLGIPLFVASICSSESNAEERAYARYEAHDPLVPYDEAMHA
jgi:hypothetical protein